MMLDFIESYDTAWADLNALLWKTEATNGLARAISQLEYNQKQTGFIKDCLVNVRRYVFPHPDDPVKQFRVQFNAKRLERFNGNGVSEAPGDMEVANGGCFLCRENIRWQQQGAELGYALDVNGKPYHAWMNPFPLMPGHVVIASALHETQDWEFGPEGGQALGGLIADLTRLAERMPGFVGFYNGVNAGASIPGHLHFQFFRRPDDYPIFPLELRLLGHASHGDKPAIGASYPLPVIKWNGSAATIVPLATRWIREWAERNARRMEQMTGNLIVTTSCEGDVTLYFVPRHRKRAKSEGLSGLIGGLEVMGELVLSSPEEEERIANGEIDYFSIEKILTDVRTPLYDEWDV